MIVCRIAIAFYYVLPTFHMGFLLKSCIFHCRQRPVADLRPRRQCLLWFEMRPERQCVIKIIVLDNQELPKRPTACLHHVAAQAVMRYERAQPRHEFVVLVVPFAHEILQGSTLHICRLHNIIQDLIVILAPAISREAGAWGLSFSQS